METIQPISPMNFLYNMVKVFVNTPISPTQGATQICGFMSPYPQLKGPLNLWIDRLKGGQKPSVGNGPKKFAGARPAR